MIDTDKTIIELIEELETLRSHVISLEKEKRQNSFLLKEREKLELSLRERVKELNCLYKITELIEQNEDSLGTILTGIVNLLPKSWQYPEVSCARIQYKGTIYSTHNFLPSKWKQEANILVDGKQQGTVEVYYLKNMPLCEEGPFLKEERQLINAVSERIGRAAQHLRDRNLLEEERNTLKNTNIALYEVLDKISGEKKRIGASIQNNVDKVIFPLIYALEKNLNSRQKKYLKLIKDNLEDIIAPFAEEILPKLSSLSPVETLIANMIKNGMTTKEIAEIRGVSPDTINRHREHIRRKLDLTNKKINLTTYLNNLSSKGD